MLLGLPGFAELIALFSIVHQAMLELYKLLSRYKMRRYWDALAYVVYGPDARVDAQTPDATNRPDAAGYRAVSALKRPIGAFSRMPIDLNERAQRELSRGDRLIESFLLRAVGDSPVSEISDSDIRNVIEMAREIAGPAGHISRMFEDLIRAGTRRPDGDL